MFCTAVTKNEKACPYKAKYTVNDHSQYRFCKIHALTHSNSIMNTEYDTIESNINLVTFEKKEHIDNTMINGIIDEIKTIYNIELTIIPTKNKGGNTLEQVVEYTNELGIKKQYILRIATTPSVIEQYVNNSSTYASIFTFMNKPITVPIVSINIENKPYLVRQNKFNEYYYELSESAHPIIKTIERAEAEEYIINIFDLIERSHELRIIHGSIEFRNLSLLTKNIDSIVFTTLKNSMFWIDKYGNRIDEESSIDNEIEFDSLFCSRRLQSKNHPCRYDDIESLLFLACSLLDYDLPWIGLTTNKDMIKVKNQFLTKLSESKDSSNIAFIAKLITSSHFDDRPIYQILKIAFQNIFSKHS